MPNFTFKDETGADVTVEADAVDSLIDQASSVYVRVVMNDDTEHESSEDYDTLSRRFLQVSAA